MWLYEAINNFFSVILLIKPRFNFQRRAEKVFLLLFMLVPFIPRKESIYVTLFSNDILFAGKQAIAFVLFSASHSVARSLTWINNRLHATWLT